METEGPFFIQANGGLVRKPLQPVRGHRTRSRESISTPGASASVSHKLPATKTNTFHAVHHRGSRFGDPQHKTASRGGETAVTDTPPPNWSWASPCALCHTTRTLEPRLPFNWRFCIVEQPWVTQDGGRQRPELNRKDTHGWRWRKPAVWQSNPPHYIPFALGPALLQQSYATPGVACRPWPFRVSLATPPSPDHPGVLPLQTAHQP